MKEVFLCWKTTGWSVTECKDLDMQLILTLGILKLFVCSCICVIHLHMDKQLKRLKTFTYQSYRILMKFIVWKLKSKFREHS